MLMAAHLTEVFVWSMAYAMTNAAPDRADLTYFALVNYTTRGYGDITPVARWRLLGADDGDEWRPAVWLVDRGDLRGAAQDDRRACVVRVTFLIRLRPARRQNADR